MKKFLKFLLQLLWRYKTFNEEVLRTPGPVLLLPNHVSWFDWLFLAVALEDDWKFVTSASTAQLSPLHRLIMVNRFTFPVDTDSPYAVKKMAEFLQGGGRMVLFPEGRISQTGTLMKLFDGTGFLIHKTKAKVITCYLRGANRMPFSPHPGWKKCFPKVTAHFSPALTAPECAGVSMTEARYRLTTWLRDNMVFQQFETEMAFGAKTIPEAILESAHNQPCHRILEDATHSKLTYNKLVIGAHLLGKKLAAIIPSSNQRVGILLPNVNGTPVTLLGLWLEGKIPAVLNFTTGIATMLACVKLANLKQVVTSRTFLARAKLDLSTLESEGVQLIYLEDIRASISSGDKIRAAFEVSMADVYAVKRPPQETAVILFTSGSEGVPKGVELTHQNLLSNIRQMLAVTDLQDRDRVFNALPLFHSFGLTVGTLLSLVRGMYIFLYPSPLHYRVVPTAFYHTNCTVMLGTNTFLNGYARKAHPYDFRSLRYMFAGAEKLQEATARTWAQRFGVRILEGYGATECSPCVSLNTPLAAKFGSAGRLMPGMDYKLEAVEGVPEGGRLLVRGPNVMKGYLNDDANSKFKALGGWYDTGDIVTVDQEGFVSIQGRLKRFAKVSGEMISLTAVEEALAGAFLQYGMRFQAAIVTRPDEDKGEVLIVVSNDQKLTLEEVRTVLRTKGLPNLAVPREIKFLREIPKLGTGKVNHRELQALVSQLD